MLKIIFSLMFVWLSTKCYSQTNDWGKRIKSKEHLPLRGLLNAHVSPIKTIEIDGHKFNNVRGFKPFYLPLDKIKSIIFVVDEADYSMTYHVFNMDTDQDTEIKAKGDLFGAGIGFKDTEPFKAMADSAEVVEKHFIKTCVTLHFRGVGQSPSTVIKGYVTLDLLKTNIASRERVVFDTDGKIIKTTLQNYSK